MEGKIKFIIIPLIVIIAISIFINLQTLNSKKVIEKERNELKNENTVLIKKIEELTEDKKSLEERIDSLNSDLDKISKEKEEIQKQFDLIVKERDELIKKLESQTKRVLQEPKKENQSIVAVDTSWSEALKTDLGYQLEKMRSELKNAQIDNEQLRMRKKALELELSNLTREKEELEQQLGYHQKVLDSMGAEIALEKEVKFRLQESLKSIKNENVILRRQLKSLSDHKIASEKKLTKLEEEKSNLERRFNEMALLLEDKLAGVSDLKQQLDILRSGGELKLPEPKKEPIELPPIVIHPQVDVLTPEKKIPLEGKILTVNKENNFVVVDLGEDSGLKLGDVFGVYREDKAIATIEVIQIRKAIAACNIKTETMPVKVGDTVR